MSKRDETIAYNMAAIRRMTERQTAAATTGGTCPECGQGANPAIVARFGHCLACQNATLRG